MGVSKDRMRLAACNILFGLRHEAKEHYLLFIWVFTNFWMPKNMNSLHLNSSFIKTDMKILFLGFGEESAVCCFSVWKAKYVGGRLINTSWHPPRRQQQKVRQLASMQRSPRTQLWTLLNASFKAHATLSHVRRNIQVSCRWKSSLVNC